MQRVFQALTERISNILTLEYLNNKSTYIEQLNNIFKKKDGIGWVFLQQIFIRGLVALKLFIAARILGPELIGEVGELLLAILIIETITTTGMQQAIIQNPLRANNKQLSVIWTFQAIRGMVIAISMYAISTASSNIIELNISDHLIYASMAIVILRNLQNPGVFLAQRARNFRGLAYLEIGCTSLDFIITLLLLKEGFKGISILYGLTISELVKLSFTWIIFRVNVNISVDFKIIKDFTNFGKWIWSSLFISLILNQFDKVLIAKYLGATDFGIYQLSYRISQIIIVEPISILSQYLYPTISQALREHKDVSRIIKKSILFTIFYVLIMSLGLLFSSKFIVNKILGSEWDQIINILHMIILPTSIGSIIIIISIVIQAFGHPKVITKSTIIQLISLLIVTPLLFEKYEINGLILALSISGLAVLIYDTYSLKTLNKYE